MELGATRQYKDAIAGLTALKEELGKREELKAIARFLLYCEPAEAPDLLFPFTGTDDPRDRAIVDGYKRA
ncbi:MAG TPA: hypothetical protein V6C46_06335, partial [Coleofasciculaceae cyanobacterium]